MAITPGAIELCLSGAGLLSSLLIGSGFMKWVLGLHTKVTLLEKDSEKFKGDITRLDSTVIDHSQEVGYMKKSFELIESRLSKLDVLERLAATVETLKDQLECIVPRNEIEARLRPLERSHAEEQR